MKMFTDPLTSLDYYWIGYFQADGCISKIPRGVNAVFTQSELYPVK